MGFPWDLATTTRLEVELMKLGSPAITAEALFSHTRILSVLVRKRGTSRSTPSPSVHDKIVRPIIIIKVQTKANLRSAFPNKTPNNSIFILAKVRIKDVYSLALNN